ncbi:MAG: PEGA domain-containing protein [Proteobacteria bacterium]|nr:PEGA domain-containing protein [Pseudomonadota bacterium]
MLSRRIFVIDAAIVAIFWHCAAVPAVAGHHNARHQVNLKIQQAQLYLVAANYREAITAVMAGLTIAPREPRLLQMRAHILYTIHDYTGALAALQTFLDNARPRPSPGDVREARRIIRSLRRANSTFLTIEVINGPASVYFDDRALGAICQDKQICKKSVLPRRTYWVLVERQGFRPYSKRVSIRSKKTAISVELEQLPSRATIEVKPVSAEVTVDGVLIGTGRQVIDELTAGEHVVAVAAPGHVAQKQTISAYLGQPVTVRTELAKMVPVIVEPASARAVLTVDEQATELHDGALHLSTGPHRIRARAEGYDDAVVDISAHHQAGEPVIVRLQPKPRPSPPREHKSVPDHDEWNTSKTVAVATTGALSALGYVAAAGFALEARSDWKQAEEHCRNDDGREWLCNRSGMAMADEARAMTRAANLSFAGSAAASLGLLWALNMNEADPANQRMTVRRKLSIATAATAAGLGLTVGTYHSLRAHTRQRQSRNPCTSKLECDRQRDVNLRKAHDHTRLANINFAMAGLAATTALVLWWTAPSRPSRAGLKVNAAVSSQAMSVGIGGVF